jgi:hypothetical protein
VELFVNEVKSIQYCLNFLPDFARGDFERLKQWNFSIVGQQAAVKSLFYFVFHLKVLSVLISIFPLKEQCVQWDELLDFFGQFFVPACALEGNQELVLRGPQEPGQLSSVEPAKIVIHDEYLLSEFVSSLTRVC